MECISIEGSSKWTPDTITDVSTLLLAISTTDFLSAMVITNTCLKYLLGLTRSLQAVAEINHIKSALCDVRDHVGSNGYVSDGHSVRYFVCCIIFRSGRCKI